MTLHLGREVEKLEKDAQVDSTGSAGEQGSMPGHADAAPRPGRAASPEEAAAPQAGFQAYRGADFGQSSMPLPGQQPTKG